ncbi:MAG: DUF1926 domain-containing protein, partial [archaeon]|nr:DUF1926 domain-containing protein [archaeon]
LGYETKGAWLSERVWEPHYPTFFEKVGLNYVIVDDNHLRSCGLTEEDTFYPYTTEDSGNIITVFPINQAIRYLSPWRPAYETIEYLEKNADEKGDRIILFLSDAEKMGVWGTTHELCYEKGHDQEDNMPYINAFFTGIEKSEIIKPITLSEYIETYPSKGLIYFPAATYDKMEEWVLPSSSRLKLENLQEDIKKNRIPVEYIDKFKDFIKGGFWRYFLVKYPESNNMHKKMLYVRNRLLKIEEYYNSHKNLHDESTSGLIKHAWDEIYKSQCNDCYWHGQFGGIYLHFLRHAVYEHLINAENVMDNLEKRWNKDSKMIVEKLDFDKDSREEIIISNSNISLALKPTDGGTMFELDYKPKSYNILNTLTRWYEAYHKPEEVVIDRWRKSAFRDHFIDKNLTLDDYIAEKYEELGDFVDGEYKTTINHSSDKEIITLRREGQVCIEGEKIFLNVEKSLNITPNSSSINVEYLVSSDHVSTEKISKLENLCIAIDLPFIFSGDPNKFSYQKIPSDIEHPFFKSVSLKFDELIFEDPQYELKYCIKIGPSLKNSAENAFLQTFKYQITCFARTNNGYKEVYEGMNVVLRLDLLNILGKKINFILEFK